LQSRFLIEVGSYKEYVVSPERYTSLIPDGVSDYVAGPIMCSASTAYSSIKESGLRPGQWAVFPGGGGGVGIQGVQLAVAMGLRVVIVDTGAERKALGKKYGAEHFVDFKETEDTAAEVVKLTNGGAHAVFVTGGTSYTLQLTSLTSFSGTIVSKSSRVSWWSYWRPSHVVSGFSGHFESLLKFASIGLPPTGKFNMEINPSALVFKNQSVKGTLVAGLGEVDETLDFARRGMCGLKIILKSSLLRFALGLLKLEPTIVGLSQFNESVQKLRNGEVAGYVLSRRLTKLLTTSTVVLLWISISHDLLNLKLECGKACCQKLIKDGMIVDILLGTMEFHQSRMSSHFRRLNL
jgi:alcohol dehydrogenase, propanol-preferring